MIPLEVEIIVIPMPLCGNFFFDFEYNSAGQACINLLQGGDHVLVIFPLVFLAETTKFRFTLSYFQIQR